MRIVSYFVFSLVVAVGFFSCKKEKSFEIAAPAAGSLKNATDGTCLPKNAVGAFIAGTALSDSNYTELDVDVTSEGAYTIKTDTINGYSFSGTGNFTQTGINRIRLIGNGTPQAAGENEFAVIYDTSFCFMPVTVLPAGSNSGPAAFTLQGAGDSCIIATLSGTYLQNTLLDGTGASVSIRINATSTGTYSVTTNTVNGFRFSGSGMIGTIGEQIITLTASGTPETESSTVFPVTAGNTTCAFSVPVGASDVPPPPPVGTGDLFPLSANSWWSYVAEEGETADTLTIRNVGTTVFNQMTYNRFKYDESDVLEDEANYRKDGDNYFEYGDVTKYSSFSFDTGQKGDILFLKENLTAGASWNSVDFTGTSNNTPITLRYVFTCTAVNATETVNGISFSGITKINFKAQAGTGGVFADAGPVITLYFAKGVGLIYQAAEGVPDYTAFIKNYKVN